MTLDILLLLIVLFVFALCAHMAYLGMAGIEDEERARMEDRKELENQLIWNGMWKLVGGDLAILNKAIHLLEGERVRTMMTDNKRITKLALLKKYRSSLNEERKLRKTPADSVYRNFCNRYYDWRTWSQASMDACFCEPYTDFICDDRTDLNELCRIDCDDRFTSPDYRFLPGNIYYRDD